MGDPGVELTRTTRGILALAIPVTTINQSLNGVLLNLPVVV